MQGLRWPLLGRASSAKTTIFRAQSNLLAGQVPDWIKGQGIGARFIEPGSSWQNGHNESFNGVFRDGCLNRWLFESVREAREASESWLVEYNEERPHGSLGGLTPVSFFERVKHQEREIA